MGGDAAAAGERKWTKEELRTPYVTGTGLLLTAVLSFATGGLEIFVVGAIGAVAAALGIFLLVGARLAAAEAAASCAAGEPGAGAAGEPGARAGTS